MYVGVDRKGAELTGNTHTLTHSLNDKHTVRHSNFIY